MQRILVILLLLIIFSFHALFGQTVRFDLSGGFVQTNVSNQLRFNDGSSGYTTFSNIYNFKFQYFTQIYRFNHFLDINFNTFPNHEKRVLPIFDIRDLIVSSGLNLSFKIGLSDIQPLIGIGYHWKDFKISHHKGSLFYEYEKNIAYICGVNCYFPFLDYLDAMFAYRLILTESGKIENTNNFLKYEIETPSIYHLVTMGISLKLNKKDKIKN